MDGVQKAATLVAAMLIGLLACSGPEPAAHGGYPPACHEDDPCWDCRTMGNRFCGVEP